MICPFGDHNSRSRLLRRGGRILSLSLLILAVWTASSSALSLKLLKKVTVGNGARPEVVAGGGKVFVVYLDTSKPGNPAYSVKIYDKDMNREIAYKTLTGRSADYGRPTDIRIVSGGGYLYAFYEKTDGRVSSLFAAKYTLDESFKKVAYTSEPIAQGPAYRQESPGDEILNDPVPLIGPRSVFVITRIKKASFSKEVPMIYRVREYSTDLKTKLSQFDLDLSGVAGGQGRQASAAYFENYFYLLVSSSTKSGDYPESMAAPSDLLLVKLDLNWKVVKAVNLTKGDGDDVETFILGFKIKDGLFFVTNKHGRREGGRLAFKCPLKIYNRSFKLVSSVTVKKATGRGESLRSALEVAGDRVYVGLSAGQGPPPPGMGGRGQPGGSRQEFDRRPEGAGGGDFPGFGRKGFRRKPGRGAFSGFRGRPRFQRKSDSASSPRFFQKEHSSDGQTKRTADVYLYELL